MESSYELAFISPIKTSGETFALKYWYWTWFGIMGTKFPFVLDVKKW